MSYEQEAQEVFERIYLKVIAPQLRYRYFEDERGVMYCWTTEKDSNGKYYAFNYVPYGPGSRSGRKKVTKWRMRNKVQFARRKKAKERALSRYSKGVTK